MYSTMYGAGALADKVCTEVASDSALGRGVHVKKRLSF
jgi:hypothetical protein